METEQQEGRQSAAEVATDTLAEESVIAVAPQVPNGTANGGAEHNDGDGDGGTAAAAAEISRNAQASTELLPVKPNQSLEAIRRKLSSAGLTDEVKLSAAPQSVQSKPKLSHRRSRSLGEGAFNATIVVPSAAAPGNAIGRSLKLSCANLGEAKTTGPGLEQIKQSLLREIKTKLQEQIESKKLECHTDEETAEKQVIDHNNQSQSQVEKKKEQDVYSTADGKSVCTAEAVASSADNTTPVTGSAAATPQPDDGTKRFSICSLSGIELRKKYSPVYERTRKIVRQSSGSINRWSSSQPQVVPQQRNGGPSSPSASLDTQGTATVLSPVTSKGELETETEKEKESDKSLAKEGLVNGDTSVPSSQSNMTTTASSTRIGQYSAHPSVYVIEQDRKMMISGSTGIDDSRSDKMDRSTSTLKRGASFKGLRKNIKKTFSTTIPALTLEKADKAPGTNVPAIVMCCVETLERKGFLRTEGLYRSSPSQLEVRKVIKHARKGQYDYVKSVDDPVILAGTLKSFFFNLKHHIISEEVMEKNFPKKCLLGNLREPEYIERLKGVVSDLGTTHYESLEYIIKHLQEVASHSKFNLMTPANLGVVWAPCLFTNCDKSLNGADLLSFMGEQTRLLELLITHADLLFDRYTLDEIMIAIEDGYSADMLRDGEPTLNLRPDFDSMLGGGSMGGDDFERRKLLRNLSLTFDNVFEASNNNDNGDTVTVRRHYDLQNSSTVPAMTTAQSDGTVGRPRIQKMKRSRSKAVCVVS